MSSFLFGPHKKTSIRILTKVLAFPADTTLEIDATLSEGFGATSQITDHPVEQGTDVSDHIRRQPETLELRGVVSNTPIMALSSLRAVPVLPGGDPTARAEEALSFLLAVKDAGVLVVVSTTLRDYEGFAITSISVARDKGTRNIVDLSLSLRELQIAVTETVDAPVTTDKTRKAKSNKGKKPKADASSSTTSSSAAAKAIGAISSFFGG